MHHGVEHRTSFEGERAKSLFVGIGTNARDLDQRTIGLVAHDVQHHLSLLPAARCGVLEPKRQRGSRPCQLASRMADLSRQWTRRRRRAGRHLGVIVKLDLQRIDQAMVLVLDQHHHQS